MERVTWKLTLSISVSRSVVPDSLQPHGLQPTRLHCPWDFPGKDTGVGCHFLLQGIFPTQGSNPGLLHCRQILYWLSYKGMETYITIYKIDSQQEFAVCLRELKQGLCINLEGWNGEGNGGGGGSEGRGYMYTYDWFMHSKARKLLEFKNEFHKVAG